MFKNKTVIIKPKSSRLYGQTNRMNSVEKTLGIEIIVPTSKNYDKISKYDNLVVFDTEDEDILSLVNKFPKKRVVSHFQLNPSYLGLDSVKWKTSKEMLDKSNIVIVPADFLRIELLKHNIRTNILTVPNGVDTNIFKLIENRSNQPKIGYVGKLVNSKGFQVLKYLWDNCPSTVTLQIDSVNNNSPKVLENRVLSNLSIERSNHPTPTFDCLISTSLSEVAPLVIIEALTSGVPVIATESTPYINELQKHFGDDYVQTVSIPKRLEKLSMKNLHLDELEVQEIGTQFLNKLTSCRVLCKTTKSRIRDIALKLGFSSDRMCNEFGKIYMPHS